MTELNFILISDRSEIEDNLRIQLDVVGENYCLTRVDYPQATTYLNAKKYDRVFASLDKENLREQGNYLLALGRTTATPVTILEQDKTMSQAIVKMQKQSPNLESVLQPALGKDLGLLNAFFNFSVEAQREQRMRSDARSKENVEQWQKISKLEIAVEHLLEDQEKLEKFFYYGTTSPDGRDNSVLAAAAWVHQTQGEFTKLQMEVRDLRNYVTDCSTELQKHLQKLERREQSTWQTKFAIGLAVLGLCGSIGAAFVPLVFNSDPTIELRSPKATQEK